jgi:hypothetical protein
MVWSLVALVIRRALALLVRPTSTDRGPSPSAAGAPSASRLPSVPLERPLLPRSGEPSLGAGDLAHISRDAPDRAPLAPRARPTEVVS